MCQVCSRWILSSPQHPVSKILQPAKFGPQPKAAVLGTLQRPSVPGKLISMRNPSRLAGGRGARTGAVPSGGAHALAAPGRVTALLGPTNTGKTFLAIERMLAHRSGMIGLPLRLLAREVYEKVVRLKGTGDVALITGEERVVPAHPRYYVCTVEAMPVGIPVAFLAVDEIQLCADLERGHVFTDRLLHARGLEETMLLGAATMRGAIQRLAPQSQFVARPRFSDLAYTGSKKLTRLPRRSVIVAFSAEDVYGLADLVRSQRGGAAVVMGALSPRTRNAQVALYQSGAADFLVATDAIGMGINMDVDHVAFAARDKFDGVIIRPLRPDELGQIAGRAGRYMNDGTFGVTADCDPLEPDLVAQIESHRYDPVHVLQWRSSALEFFSVDSLLFSLDVPPPARGLTRARTASDHWTLKTLVEDETIRAMASAPATVRLLWDTCQIPDFRKLTPDEHARLVRQIFHHLAGDGVLPDDWLAEQIGRLDVADGGVDTLSGRLAQIRTWTYAAHRPGWTRDPAHWQERTRAIEDRLSDALHERLTQRFIDRRTSVLMRHLREEDYLVLAVDEAGAVTIGNEYVGKLEGFRFAPDPRAEGIHGRTLRAAAMKGLEAEILARGRALIDGQDDAFHLSEHGQLWWSGAPVARLAPGTHPLSPSVLLLADDTLRGDLRNAVRARLEAWVNQRIGIVLEPLVSLRRAADEKNSDPAGGALSGLARGFAYQLAEGLGHLERQRTASIPELRSAEHALRRFGVHFGRHAVYIPKLMKPMPSSLAALLWAVHRRVEPIPPPPTPGRTSLALDGELSLPFLAAAFYRAAGGRAVRLDILERADSLLAAAAREKQDAIATLTPLASMLGCSIREAADVASALGWERAPATRDSGSAHVWRRRPERHGARRKSGADRPRPRVRPESPFAELASLIPAD